MTEVVYVCSKNYWRHLFISLRTLFASGTKFDRVKVLVTGNKPRWSFDTDRIIVKSVPDIGDGYWYLNKTHVCKSEADTLIFLDTDTVVLNRIESIYENVNKDLIAREAPSVNTKYYYPEKWKKKLSHFNAEEYPYLSCGFMVFQNGKHREIARRWRDITKRLLGGEGQNQVTRFAEQEAMSIAASAEGMSLKLMEPHHHAYAMIGESYRGAVVYHLGTPNFYHYYLKVERDMGLKNISAPVKRPRFLRGLKFLNRLRKRLRRMRGADRDADVSWKGV